MALKDCINAAVEAGEISAARGEALLREQQRRVKEYAAEGKIAGPEAESRVTQRLIEERLRTIERKKRMARNAKRIQNEIIESAQEAIRQGFGVDTAMYGRLSFDPMSRYRGPSLEQRISTVKGRAHSRMADALEEFRTRKAGLTQRLHNLEPMIREMFGENTGNTSAKAMAKGVNDAIDYLTDQYNAAGGDILKRKNWGFFQRHDPALMTRAGKEEWKRFTFERLNMDEMRDVNGFKMTREQVWRSLDEAYDTIATRGLSDIAENPGPRLFASNVNQRANSRFLVFKDADAWMEYQKTFGSGNFYESIVAEIDRLARDVATLQVLGPYPEATLRVMERQIDEGFAKGALSATGKKAAKNAKKIGTPKHHLRALFNTVTGKTGISSSSGISGITQANRNVVTSATLGGAFFAAFGDVPLQGATARMNGMPVFKTWTRVARTFLTNSTQDRRLAVRLGFTAQGWASRAIAAQRVLGEVVGPEWSERMTDTVLRASLLSPWTEAGRYGFMTELLGFITHNSGRQFDELPSALRNSFERHGITADDWELIRATEKWVDPDTGADFIRAEDIADGLAEGARFDAANKLQDMLFQEVEFAVPQSTGRIRAALTQGTTADTFLGSVLRDVALFKSFPVSILYLHYSRIMAKANPVSKAEYASWLLLGMTTMGIVGEQLTSISRGRDPEPMSPGLLVRGLIRGGSLGLMGDILLQDQNRFGGGMSSLMGPIADEVQDIFKLTVGNVQNVLAGEDTNAGRELSRFIEQNWPGRSIWYGRLAMERLIFDNLDFALDPEARSEFTALERRTRKERNQRFWSRPGRGLIPQRAPDFGRVLETEE